MRAAPEIVLDPGDHVVHFYDDDAELIETVGDYASTALAGGDTVVLFTTAAHRAAVDAILERGGIDVEAARHERRLVTPDAAEVLRRFVTDSGAVDAGAIREVVGPIIEAAANDNVGVAAFGEMVALLWRSGDVLAAIELERLGNALIAEGRFRLLCGYPSELLRDGERQDDALRAVCGLHTAVFRDDEVEPGEVSRRFDADARAPRAARRFVADVLRRWGHSAVVDDAALVVAELTTNALIHTRSGFAVTVRVDPHRVRLAVRDDDPAVPVEREAGPLATSGRGVGLVKAVAQDWGIETLSSHAKEVWAELGFPRSRATP